MTFVMMWEKMGGLASLGVASRRFARTGVNAADTTGRLVWLSLKAEKKIYAEDGKKGIL